MHVPKENRSKLDVKSKKCIFLGYGDGERGYRLWDPSALKLVRSRDVVFNENNMFKEESTKSEKLKIPLENSANKDRASNQLPLQ